ncbi:hypothetical protein [Aquamicrobium sp. LC103]|uniref:hypothetical protein n=1 Tax=Aquamicrobium sp. LC103 TaxID=1120658 RepID=UPI00063E8234|nr:hypothetical protein [Aquamicrobium sp. LC103]TKT82501.1 hypothetical protein XW59_000615 [Aquamicrobium sp. LC103]
MRLATPHWTQGTFVTVAAITVLALICLFVRSFPHIGYVNQLTVSGGILRDTDKLRDVALVPLAILLQLILIAGYVLLPQAGQKEGGRWWVWVLAGIYVAILVWFDRGHFLAAIASLATTFWLQRFFWKADWQQASGYLFLVVSAVTLLVHHLVGLNPLWIFACLAPLLALVSHRFGRRTLVVAAALGTAMLAVAALSCAPLFWWPRVSVGVTPIDGVFAAAALVVVGQGFMSLRIVFKAEETDALAAPGAFSLALAAALLSLPAANFASLSADDYHFGERLLAYQALSAGQGWFTTFLSPHGFSDAVSGILARLAGDDSAVGIQIGSGIGLQIVFFLVSWRLIARLGVIGGLCLALALPYSQDILLIQSIPLVALNLILVLEAASLRRPVLAGVLGTLLGVAGIFFNAGTGVAASLTGGMAGFVLQAMRGRRAALHFLGATAATSAVVLALVWPQAKGQFDFLRISARANLAIYGNGDIPRLKPIYFLSFLFAGAPLLAFVLARSSDASRMRRLPLWAGALVPVASFTLLFNIYAMGRIDDTALRALMTSCVLLVFLPVWLSGFQKSGLLDAPADAVVCAMLLVAIAPVGSPLLQGRALMPPSPMPQPAAISASLPRLGAGRHDPAHVQRVETVAGIVDALLEPGETFLNLTNRNALHFYLNRASPVPISSTYNAAPEEFQKAFIAALGDSPPPLALVGVGNMEHDGISLPLRSHAIYDYVLGRYVPFQREGYVFAMRRDLAARIERLPEEPHLLHRASDANWRNGVAIGANAKRWSFAVEPGMADRLRAGDRLLFSDGVERHVMEAKGINVASNLPIPPPRNDDAARLSFTIVNRTLDPLSETDLWARVFHKRNLHRIPSAWGRSSSRLADALQPSSAGLELVRMADAGSLDGRKGLYEITGVDPRWIYRPQAPLDPEQAGLLAFSVACLDPEALPKVQVFWRPSDQGFSEHVSLVFEASFPFNIVPLDSSPLWSQARDIAEIRIDIANPDQCGAVVLDDVRLLRRSPIGDVADTARR